MSDVHYAVEVRDDHDGGSVWYIEEDYLPSEPDAVEQAMKIIETRNPPGVRVVKLSHEVVGTWSGGGTKEGA
jgi:hypothetical protein